MKVLSVYKSLSAYVAAALLAVGALVASPAHAAPIDVAAIKAYIEEQAVPIGIVGSAVLLILIGITAFLWVRRAAR